MSVEPADRPGVDDSDVAVRIARLAHKAGIALDRRQLEQLTIYLNVLQRWNRAINLTSLDVEALPDGALERLVFEPLLAASALTEPRGKWYDLGSGGGSPALPMKVAVPAVPLTMVESRSRKVAFLREAIRLMGLSQVDVVGLRIDRLAGQVAAQVASAVTIRAVRVDQDVVRTIRHLLSPSGQVVLFGVTAELLLAEGFRQIRTVNGVTILRRGVPRGTIRG
ncbi:MAG: hypothetical protein FJW27_03040 [Acidimicrobiia bacterium]|nr:hypothetical protein [Acidimicrobiia bacterium]